MLEAEHARPIAGVRRARTRQGGGGLEIDATSLIRDGERWFPVSGEYHFSRDVPERWEHELRKMKAGGIDVVATYLMWILHEEVRGERRWDGHLDVRRFVQAAHRVGLAVVMRIGPWAHGEARNGGFPDWLQRLPLEHRTNDPVYLRLVEEWYADVESQLRGLFRSDQNPQAPIIAVQVDNELYDQPAHLATLRHLAEKVGMTAPLWVATGWGGAQVPQDELISVYAGYTDGFWEESDVELPAFSRMHFRFSDVRDDLSVGADVRDAPETDGYDDHRYPFITCELGGGMTTAYHRRPLVDAADITALALTKLGSRSSWQGYYVYHGTVQATGQLTGMQESHDSSYPNDMPTKDYDFFAPIGAAGTLRPHYHQLRTQHLFLQEWGARLLELPATFSDDEQYGVRASVRVRDGRGYVFVNNHQPAAEPLPDAEDVQFRLGDGVVVPSSPVSLPSGTTAVWPVRQAYGDVTALTGTVQPITQIHTDDGLVVVFGTSADVDVELEIETSQTVRGARLVETAHGARWVPEAPLGPGCVVAVGSTRLVLLDAASSTSVWAGEAGGTRIVALWDGGLVHTDDGILLERWTPSRELLTIPALAGADGRVGPFHRLALAPAPSVERADVSLVTAAGGAPETRTGGSMNRLSAPREDEWERAAVLEIALPVHDERARGARVLSIRWAGDVARAYVGDDLVSDQFWHGRPWELDLNSVRLDVRPLRIEILPWNGTADFFVDRRVRDERVAGRAEILAADIVFAEQVSVGLPDGTR
jgi:hypothetical protein